MIIIRLTIACSLGIMGLASFCNAQSSSTVIPLWSAGAPGFESRRDEPERAESYWVKNIHNPSLTAFLPEASKATGAAVIICPGGGHRELVFNAEGVQAAEYLVKQGVAAFALKYRLAREEDSPYQIDVHAKQDGQRAVRLVRARCQEFGIDPNRVGMLGFSAGGEVVSMVSYASDHEAAPNALDPIDRQSALPSFQMLVYPGPLGIPEALPEFAPRAFMLVAGDDMGAARNIVDLVPKFRAIGVPYEVHIFARGGHAFNMGNRSKLNTLSDWPQRMTDWMQDNFILDPTGFDEYQKEVDENRQRMQRFLQRQRDRSAQP
ncbi:MAG: alpha/beta hydrolase [Planctomycetales bacterium]|nr:alpha/beta hydrolase [Planctomycetales bacterium]